MTAGAIHPLPRDRVVARRDARLPTAWIGSNGEPKPDVAGHALLRRSSGETRPRDRRDTPVLVMLAADDGGAFAELVAFARGGSRVYVLVPPSWGKDVLDPHLLSSPQVLIRRVSEVPVSGVHTPRGATLWFGNVAGRTPWILELDAPQATAFRQVFLRLFWHEATEEAWTGGRQLSWRVARERPFDVPELPMTASVRLVPGNARLDLDARDGLMHLAGGGPPDVAPRCLWYPAGGDHHDRLAHLVRHGADVVWADHQLPDLVVAGGRGELLLPGSRNRVRLALTQAQVADVTRILTGSGSWRFGVDVPIAGGDGERQLFWLRGEGKARGVEHEQKIELPDVLSETLRAVPQAQPAKWPDAQPLALSVCYRWKAVPPRVPVGAEEDPLVGRWRKLDDDWASGLGRVREALQSVEGERSRIGRAFSRLVSAVLGFERTHGGLLAEVSSLEGQRPSAAGPSGAAALLSRLTELEDQAKKLQRDQDDAERKARDDEDREKQEAAWRARVEAAKQDLPARRQALSDAEAKRPAAVDARDAVEGTLKSADKEAKKDLKARRHKLSDELTLLDKEIARLRREVADLEQQVAEPFVHRPTPSPASRQSPRGGRFVPQSTVARPAAVVPEDALPEVGALCHHRGKRFLVIQTWEELEAGERAAARLAAKLVAPEDA